MSTYTDASLIVTPNAYKAGKLYSLKPTDGSGDLGVVRATTATYVDVDGVIQTALANKPRFDYSNGSCPSILVEPQRTNLLLRSEEFDNVAWVKNNTIITSNTIISPNGTLSADIYAGNGTLGLHEMIQSGVSTLISGNIYTMSIYAKKNTNNFIQIILTTFAFPSNSYANFDLNNGVIGSFGGGVTSPTITSVGNGWYRCTVTATAVATSSTNSFVTSLITSALSPRAEVNTLSTSVYIWGAQLEAGATATSYIPTVASTVTRNADVISKTGLSGITSITETFENGTTNVISGSPTSYTMSQGRIKHVIGL